MNNKTVEAQKAIATVLSVLLKAYPQSSIDDEGLKVYTSNLSEVYTPRQVELAVNEVMRHCKFLPTIADICETAEEQKKTYYRARHNTETYAAAGMKPIPSDLKVIEWYEGATKSISAGQQS